jgi:hypothetical protein
MFCIYFYVYMIMLVFVLYLYFICERKHATFVFLNLSNPTFKWKSCWWYKCVCCMWGKMYFLPGPRMK